MKRGCCHFIVSGRVQGVFFRASTQDQAILLGLSGWVRNLTSGKVELLACGDMRKIEELETWLWQGPKFAKVTEVKSEPLTETATGTLRGFDIRADR